MPPPPPTSSARTLRESRVSKNVDASDLCVKRAQKPAGPMAPHQERLTLLINARTASSAELFAGVLRWHHRAELDGTPTAGKRTVQQVVRWTRRIFRF